MTEMRTSLRRSEPRASAHRSESWPGSPRPLRRTDRPAPQRGPACVKGLRPERVNHRNSNWME